MIDGRVVTRFAPSPTGYLHLGHVVHAMYVWGVARALGGHVVMRIEDLDRSRVKPGAIDTVLRDLEWLGLDWDGEVLLQSADTSALESALERLLAEGRAYACTCSRREVLSFASAPHARDAEIRYPGTCRGRWSSPAEAGRSSTGAAGIRLRVPAGAIEIEDALAGRRAFDVQAEVGDFLLARRDGAFAYQLAVVVDDARQGVTEVVRGDDLLPSAARQWHVQRALGLPHPAWIHVPLVVDPEGRRLAKRDADLALASLRAGGVDARRLVGWIARSAGQEVDGLAAAHEVTTHFDLALVPRTCVRFGPREQTELFAAR